MPYKTIYLFIFLLLISTLIVKKKVYNLKSPDKSKELVYYFEADDFVNTVLLKVIYPHQTWLESDSRLKIKVFEKLMKNYEFLNIVFMNPRKFYFSLVKKET